MAPVGSAKECTTLFSTFISTIESEFKKACEKFDEIINNLTSPGIQAALAAAGGSLEADIATELDNLRKGLDRLERLVKYVIKHETPIASLMITSFEWTEQIKGPVSNLSSRCVNPDPAAADLYDWKGSAKDAYQAKSSQMQGAVDAMTARAEFISKWLFTITQANINFVRDLAQVVTKVAGKIVEAAGDAEDVIGLPFLGEVLGEAAGDLTEQVLNKLLDIGVQCITSLGNIRDLDGQLDDLSKLPNHAWPDVIAQH